MDQVATTVHPKEGRLFSVVGVVASEGGYRHECMWVEMYTFTMFL